jgi:hypothetical protein
MPCSWKPVSLRTGWLSAPTSPNGTPTILDLDPAHWQTTACHLAGRNLTRAEWDQYLPGRPYQTTCPQWPIGT